MTIRLATLEDFEALQTIYAAARTYMANTGNATQWGTNKPLPEETIASINKQVLYVSCDKNDTAHFTFVLIGGEDPTYSVIDGAWLNDDSYLTIHRVASDGTEHGVFNKIFEFAKTEAAKQGIANLRIDTHDNNLTMQHCITKAGFSYCGTIYLEDGSPRRGYQLQLS